MPPTPAEPLVLLARIGRPHGVRGALHIDLAGEHLRHIINQKLAILSLPTHPTPVITDYAVKTNLTLAKVEPATGEPRYVQFQEIADRDAAAALTNYAIAAPLSAMRILAANEHRSATPALSQLWYFEIVGLTVLNATDGKKLGSITAIEDLGRNTVITIQPEKGNTLTHPLEIPLNYPHWQGVDLARGTVRLSEWEHFVKANE